MRQRASIVGWAFGLALAAGPTARAGDADSAAERGRVALTATSHLPPGWKGDAYAKARRFWGPDAPDPEGDPEGYAAAFERRYGLHPAPFSNDGLPMGLRKARSKDGSKVGIQIDCLVCHGGSIGGTSYVGLGNTQLDLTRLLDELTRADGRRVPPSLFSLNTARGTNNAGQIAVVLLSLRNPDLSFRTFPLFTGANLPELDTPAWWILAKKRTKYYDGRTDARSARSNMQFLLGDLKLAEFQALEPAFLDIQEYLKSLRPPKYPFPIDRARAARGEAVFAKTCARCHGTYGPEPTYPNRTIPLDVIGTDPARAVGISDRFIAHYNATWFAGDHPVEEPMVGYQAPPLDGLWATAPYLHNGSVPTLAHLLDSKTRPARFRRPTTTDFDQYDPARVGWKAEPLGPDAPNVDRSVFDASRWGLGNRGHTFGDQLSDPERADLIEYLKTL